MEQIQNLTKELEFQKQLVQTVNRTQSLISSESRLNNVELEKLK